MTHVALIVKEDGLIYVNEVPPHYLSGEGIKKYSESFNYSDPRLAYEADIASATESAILCADQEQAKELLFYQLYGGPQVDIPWSVVVKNYSGKIFIFPDLKWEVKELFYCRKCGTENCTACEGERTIYRRKKAILTLSEQPKTKPQLICYCGSLRVAKEAFKQVEYLSVIEGNIALLPCCMYVDIQREYGADSDYKQKADELHKRKIDICDEVFVLNVDGYIGDSTRSEIEYALSIGKPVKYLENNLKENQE